MRLLKWRAFPFINVATFLHNVMSNQTIGRLRLFFQNEGSFTICVKTYNDIMRRWLGWQGGGESQNGGDNNVVRFTRWRLRVAKVKFHVLAFCYKNKHIKAITVNPSWPFSKKNLFSSKNDSLIFWKSKT